MFMKKLLSKRICFTVLIAFGLMGGGGFKVWAVQNFNVSETASSQAQAQSAEGAQDTETAPEGIPQVEGIVAGTELSNYTLGRLDVIDVIVLRHPEASGQFEINNEGKIQYDFVGDITVEGLTKEEVKNLLTERLSAYIISPDVTIKIVGYNSKVIYVVGEVGNPGKIFMRGDTITVREALIAAGLPLLTASTRRVRLITPSESGKAFQKDVNVYELLYNGDLRENFVMKPGDTLYIPATVMAKAMRVISPVTQPIGAAAGTGRTVTTGF